MKKIFFILMCFCLALSIISCKKKDDTTGKTNTGDPEPVEEAPKEVTEDNYRTVAQYFMKQIVKNSYVDMQRNYFKIADGEIADKPYSENHELMSIDNNSVFYSCNSGTMYVMNKENEKTYKLNEQTNALEELSTSMANPSANLAQGFVMIYREAIVSRIKYANTKNIEITDGKIEYTEDLINFVRLDYTKTASGLVINKITYSSSSSTYLLTITATITKVGTVDNDMDFNA